MEKLRLIHENYSNYMDHKEIQINMLVISMQSVISSRNIFKVYFAQNLYLNLPPVIRASAGCDLAILK